jgi:hypothetical protein
MSMELSTDRSTVELSLPVAAGGSSRAGLSELAWAWPALLLMPAYIAAGYAVAGAYDLPIHWPFGYLFGQTKKIVAVAYAVLVVGYLADTLRGRSGHLSGLLFSPRFFVELLLTIVAVNGTVMMFVNLKQFVPTLNPTLYDSPLWRIDSWLHLGFEPAARVSDWAGENGWMDLLDQGYVLFFLAQLAVPLLFLVSRTLRPQRAQFFFALCLLWIAGGVVYVLWPALGPVYYRPSRFVWLDEAPFARQLQMTLIQDYIRFRGDPGYYALKLSHGVAALPSMHVGVLVFFAIATHRLRAVSAALWLLTAVTFVGSLALAWHYAVDGYAGALLAGAAWWVGGRVVRPPQADGERAVRAGPGEGARVVP